MTALHGGFALRQVEQVYNKVLNAALEVLCEFSTSTLLEQPIDQEKWNRKVFKVYKTMSMLEKKKHTKPFFCKRLFKLVFVLYKLQKKQPKDEIWEQMLEQKAEEGDNESVANASILDGMTSDYTIDKVS